MVTEERRAGILMADGRRDTAFCAQHTEAPMCSGQALLRVRCKESLPNRDVANSAGSGIRAAYADAGNRSRVVVSMPSYVSIVTAGAY